MIQWTRKPTELDIDGYARQLTTGAARVGDAVALSMEADAKTNRPWKDDTGAARAGLRGNSQRVGDHIRITIAHTVQYGPVLELARGGRYAVLYPTVERHIPITTRLLQELTH